jgi:DedD protein
MEVRVRERLVGALVLVAIVVLIVPAILTGRGHAPAEPSVQPARSQEFFLDDGGQAPEEQVLVPEPVADAPGQAVASAPAGKESGKPAGGTPTAVRAKATLPPAAPRAGAAAPGSQQTASASQPSAWAVQLGAFSNRAKAEQLVAELKERRYAAFTLEYRASGQILYRVRVGPEQERARAEEIAARLAKDGFQPVVARHP